MPRKGWLDGCVGKRTARESPINMRLALVFIREQCDAESEHTLEISRRSCNPISS
jgi:hypothetical protein